MWMWIHEHPVVTEQRPDLQEGWSRRIMLYTNSHSFHTRVEWASILTQINWTLSMLHILTWKKLFRSFMQLQEGRLHGTDAKMGSLGGCSPHPSFCSSLEPLHVKNALRTVHSPTSSRLVRSSFSLINIKSQEVHQRWQSRMVNLNANPVCGRPWMDWEGNYCRKTCVCVTKWRLGAVEW